MHQYHSRDHALAVLMETAKSNRQTMYVVAKQFPEFRGDFEHADRHYYDLCARLGWDPEPVFDYDDYVKSQRYQDILSGRIP